MNQLKASKNIEKQKMKSVDTAEEWQDHEGLPHGWKMENSRDIRPKLHDHIELKV